MQIYETDPIWLTHLILFLNYECIDRQSSIDGLTLDYNMRNLDLTSAWNKRKGTWTLLAPDRNQSHFSSLQLLLPDRYAHRCCLLLSFVSFATDSIVPCNYQATILKNCQLGFGSSDLDYFSFVKHCGLSEQQTRSQYKPILRVSTMFAARACKTREQLIHNLK